MHYLKNKFTTPWITIISLFVIWRILLWGFLLLGFLFIPVAGKNFFGGGYRLYNLYFYLLPWANFDGEHYMSIAMQGYKSLEQAFFPFYPWLIHWLSVFLPNTFLTSASVGLVISNFSLLAGLFLLFKLIRLDYSIRISWLSLILLLTFPTSFYFGAVYTESLFLLLSVGSFYFFRKGNYLTSSFFGILSCTTRVFGVIVFLALLIEIWQQKIDLKKAWPAFLIPLGLFFYMFYLWVNVGDPLAFYHLQSIIGEHRQSGIVLFPQVVYRYVNILLHYPRIDIFLASFLLEFITTILFFLLPITGFFKKMRWSYLFYSMMSLLLPTIQGSFSSGSRYVLVIFPSFIIMALLLEKAPKWLLFSIAGINLVLLGVFSTLFVRGYWVA